MIEGRDTPAAPRQRGTVWVELIILILIIIIIVTRPPSSGRARSWPPADRPTRSLLPRSTSFA